MWRKKEKKEKVRTPVCAMCLMQKMGITWQSCLAFVSIFFVIISFIFLAAVLQLGQNQNKCGQPRGKKNKRTKKTPAKYTFHPRHLR